jgi:hypothetical protein
MYPNRPREHEPRRSSTRGRTTPDTACVEMCARRPDRAFRCTHTTAQSSQAALAAQGRKTTRKLSASECVRKRNTNPPVLPCQRREIPFRYHPGTLRGPNTQTYEQQTINTGVFLFEQNTTRVLFLCHNEQRFSVAGGRK